MGVALHHHPVGTVRCTATVFGCAPSRESGVCQIHGTPIEVDRTGFADETGAELAEQAVGVHELPPERVRGLRIIGGVPGVFGEGNRWFDFIGTALNPRREPQCVQGLHGLGIELRYRFRRERDGAGVTIVGTNHQPVREKIEFDIEEPVAVGDRRGRQPAWAHIEGDLPPVIEQRGVREPDLADDLRPHMQGLACVRPVRYPELRPCGGGTRL